MASLRAVRRRVCTRKRKYATLAEARDAAMAMQRRTGRQFSVYRCSFCGSAHVGKSIGVRKAAQRAKFAGRGDTLETTANTAN